MPQKFGQTGRLTDPSITNNKKLIDLSNVFYKIKLELEDVKSKMGESDVNVEFFDSWDFKDRFVVFEQLGEYKIPIIRKIFSVLQSMDLLKKQILPSGKLSYSFLNKDKLIELFKIVIASIHPDFLTPAKVLETVYQSLKLNRTALLSGDPHITLQYPKDLLQNNFNIEMQPNQMQLLIAHIKDYMQTRNLQAETISIDVINTMFSDPFFTGYLGETLRSNSFNLNLEIIKLFLINKLIDNSLIEQLAA